MYNLRQLAHEKAIEIALKVSAHQPSLYSQVRREVEQALNEHAALAVEQGRKEVCTDHNLYYERR